MKLQQEKVYYMYEDHIGKPILMTEYTDSGSNGYDKMLEAEAEHLCGEALRLLWKKGDTLKHVPLFLYTCRHRHERRFAVRKTGQG